MQCTLYPHLQGSNNHMYKDDPSLHLSTSGFSLPSTMTYRIQVLACPTVDSNPTPWRPGLPSSLPLGSLSEKANTISTVAQAPGSHLSLLAHHLTYSANHPVLSSTPSESQAGWPTKFRRPGPPPPTPPGLLQYPSSATCLPSSSLHSTHCSHSEL